MRDIDVRMAVRAELAQQHAGDDSTRIVEEMGIWSGAVRVDLAVINGELCGYELKSDSDTLKRLPLQAEMYGKVFDRLTLVVGERLYKSALAAIPEWWGCQIASMKDGVASLAIVRTAGMNPGIDPSILVQLLLKSEAVDILESFGIAKGWRSRKASEICAHLIEQIPFDDLATHVRSALKRRPKLGQIVSSDLNVPVQIQANPDPGGSGRCASPSDGVNLAVRPTVGQRISSRAKPDYLIGITPELLIHGHSAWTFDLHATENKELVGERVLGVDGRQKVDVGRRTGSDAAIVAEVEPVRKSSTRKSLPQNQLVSVKPVLAKAKAGKSRRNAAPKKSDTAPLRSRVQGRKCVRHRDAKGRYVGNADS